MKDGALLPRNAKALVYLPWWHAASRGPCGKLQAAWQKERNKTFVVERLQAGRSTAVPYHLEAHLEQRPHNAHTCAIYLLVIPDAPMVAGGRYRFVGPSHRKQTITVRVAKDELKSGAAKVVAGLPKKATIQVPQGGSCRRSIEVDTVEAVLTLPAAARRFRDALMFTTLVNGKVWRPTDNLCGPTPTGRSWRGHGKELLYTPCQWTTELKGNKKLQLRMKAELPGTNVAFTSPPVELVLPCTDTPQDPVAFRKKIEEDMRRWEAKRAKSKAAAAASSSAPSIPPPVSTASSAVPPTPAPPTPAPPAPASVPTANSCAACTLSSPRGSNRGTLWLLVFCVWWMRRSRVLATWWGGWVADGLPS